MFKKNTLKQFVESNTSASNSLKGVLGQIVAERIQDYRHHSLGTLDTSITSAGIDVFLGAPRPQSKRFKQALIAQGADSQRAASSLALIAEIKCASPSKGHIANLDPLAAAQAYRAGGANALSVLTEPRHFGGSPEALQIVAKKQDLPVLRKDFVVHPAMLCEAADWGASAILLMVSVLGSKIGEYIHWAHHLGLDALVEVHDENELHLAISSGAEIIGVNNRDLTTLQIDLSTSPRLITLARQAGFSGVLVAESGYRTSDEIAMIRGQADAVLVGSSLAGSGDLEQAVRRLMSVV